MGTFSIWHWLVVLLVVVLIFGTKKLRGLGSDLGGAIRGFKDGLKEGEGEHAANAPVGPTHSPKLSGTDDDNTLDIPSKEVRSESKP